MEKIKERNLKKNSKLKKKEQKRKDLQTYLKGSFTELFIEYFYLKY